MTVYELRTFVATPEHFETLVEQWERTYLPLYRDFYDVVGAFVSHPEKADMPDGVALLLRHSSLEAADNVQARLDSDDRLSAVSGPGWNVTTGSVRRQVLSPSDFSALA